jgi:hypothetical protein
MGFECGSICGGQFHRKRLFYFFFKNLKDLNAEIAAEDSVTAQAFRTWRPLALLTAVLILLLLLLLLLLHTHTHTHTLHCRALMRYMYVNIYNFGCGHGCRSGCAWMWVCVGVMGVGVGAYHMSGLYISSYEWVAGRRG